MSKSGKQRIFYSVECDVDMSPKEALPGISVKQVSNGFSIRYKSLSFSIIFQHQIQGNLAYLD